MTHLENVSVADLRNALDAVERKRPTQRLMVAIAYKNGISQTELASWYDVERKTVYNWLTRLESRPNDLPNTARDHSRPGRVSRLAADDRQEFLDTLREPPESTGYDAPAWTPELVRRHLEQNYDTSYSLNSCRRLLREAGLTYRTASQLDVSGDIEEFCAAFTASRGGWTRPSSQ